MFESNNETAITLAPPVRVPSYLFPPGVNLDERGYLALTSDFDPLELMRVGSKTYANLLDHCNKYLKSNYPSELKIAGGDREELVQQFSEHLFSLLLTLKMHIRINYDHDPNAETEQKLKEVCASYSFEGFLIKNVADFMCKLHPNYQPIEFDKLTQAYGITRTEHPQIFVVDPEIDNQHNLNSQISQQITTAIKNKSAHELVTLYYSPDKRKELIQALTQN